MVADASYDVWGQVKPRLIEAAGNVVAASADLYKDVFDEHGLIAKVEEDETQRFPFAVYTPAG